MHRFLLACGKTKAFSNLSDHNHLVAFPFEHYDQQSVGLSGAILSASRLTAVEIDWERAAEIRSLGRMKFGDNSGSRLPLHELSTDLIREPNVQMSNILRPIRKREDMKSFGIGSDNAQSTVNYDQAGTSRDCIQVFPTFRDGASQLPAASDELAWPLRSGDTSIVAYLIWRMARHRLAFPAAAQTH